MSKNGLLQYSINLKIRLLGLYFVFKSMNQVQLLLLLQFISIINTLNYNTINYQWIIINGLIKKTLIDISIHPNLNVHTLTCTDTVSYEWD